MMEIYSIETGNLKLDGGAIYGVVPKVLWQKHYPPDELNRINLAMRSMLIVDGSRIVLIDTGVGDKQDEKFFSHYEINGADTLESSLQARGFSPSDITDVVHTHLHFDHCGGSVKINERGEYEPAFPNAIYHISKTHWDEALNPNAREKASFLKENILPLQEAGKVNFIQTSGKLTENIELKIYNGHTRGQIVPHILCKGKTVVFCADLVPLVSNVPIAWVSAYDMEPSVSLKEKEEFLQEAFKNDYILFFQHDIYNECCNLEDTPKGIRPKSVFKLSSITG